MEERRAGSSALAMACAGWLVWFLPLSGWGAEARQETESPSATAAYRDCLVQKVQPARSAVAASHLQQACQRIFAPDTGTLQAKKGAPAADGRARPLSEQENDESVDTCLLNYLPTVHNDQSAQAMVHLCREQFGSVANATAPDNTPSRWLQWLGIGAEKQKQAPADLTIRGDGFVPLVPWQAGQPR